MSRRGRAGGPRFRHHTGARRDRRTPPGSTGAAGVEAAHGLPRPARIPVLAGLFLLLVLLLAPAAALPAQEAAGTGEQAERGPLLVEAPRQFRVTATGGALAWEDASTRSPDDGGLWGVDVERILFPYLSARLGGAFGTSSIAATDRSVDVDTYVVEVLLEPRLALPALLEAGLVPFGTVGVGTVVHDPDAPGLITRSQNAFAYGLGAEYLFLPRFGVRAEWRRYSVELENVFDQVDRTGETRDADRFQVGVFWTF